MASGGENHPGLNISQYALMADFRVHMKQEHPVLDILTFPFLSSIFCYLTDSVYINDFFVSTVLFVLHFGILRLTDISTLTASSVSASTLFHPRETPSPASKVRHLTSLRVLETHQNRELLLSRDTYGSLNFGSTDSFLLDLY